MKRGIQTQKSHEKDPKRISAVVTALIFIFMQAIAISLAEYLPTSRIMHPFLSVFSHVLEEYEHPDMPGIVKKNVSTAEVTVDIKNREEFTLSYVPNRKEIDEDTLKREAFGGLYILYDLDPRTMETTNPFDFDEAFPNGITIGVSSENVSEVVFEITDEGKEGEGDLRSKVRLVGITSEWQYYTMPKEIFDQALHFDQIKQLAIVFDSKDGTADKSVNVHWGGYFYAEPLLAKEELTSVDVKKLPYISETEVIPETDPVTGDYIVDPDTGEMKVVEVTTVAKARLGRFQYVLDLDMDGKPDTNTTNVDVIPINRRRFQIYYELDQEALRGLTEDQKREVKDSAFGGMYINYDMNPDQNTHPGVNPFDYDEAFPRAIDPDTGEIIKDGIVVGVRSIENVDEVAFEITDTTGFLSQVRLTDITEDIQYFRIAKENFDPGIDFRNIQTITMVFDGTKKKKVEVDWDGYYFTERIEVDPTAGPNSVTGVPELNNKLKPRIYGYVGNQDNASVSARVTSSTTADVVFTGQEQDASFGGIFISYDLDADDPVLKLDRDVFNFDTAFPNGIVLGLSSEPKEVQIPDPNDPRSLITVDSLPVSEVLFGVKDAKGLNSAVVLTNIQPGVDVQYFTIKRDDFDPDLDFEHIEVISLTVDSKTQGTGTRNFHIVWDGFH